VQSNDKFSVPHNPSTSSKFMYVLLALFISKKRDDECSQTTSFRCPLRVIIMAFILFCEAASCFPSHGHRFTPPGTDKGFTL